MSNSIAAPSNPDAMSPVSPTVFMCFVSGAMEQLKPEGLRCSIDESTDDFISKAAIAAFAFLKI